MLPLRLAELDLAERGRERERESERGHCFEENLANDRPIERPSLPTFILHRLARGALAPISTLNSSLLPPPRLPLPARRQWSPSPSRGFALLHPLEPLRRNQNDIFLSERANDTCDLVARSLRACRIPARFTIAQLYRQKHCALFLRASAAIELSPMSGGATRQRLSESLDETFGRTRTFRASRRDDGTSRLA
jgi:hypothetical protein